MSIAAIRFVNRKGTKALRALKLLRMISADEPCTPKQSEPCSPKAGPCRPPPTASSTCPEPPPCPPVPQCPPTICPPTSDSNNPCNYCPPPCPDPSKPDMTKLKKLQCMFQEDKNIPVYLKKGNFDAFLCQLTFVLTIMSLVFALYKLHKLF